MGPRLARATFAAVAAVATFLAVPAAVSGASGEDRPAQSQSQAHARDAEAGKPAEAGTSEAKAEPKGSGKPSAAPTTSPQPKSKADTNPGGANNGGDCGAYCSTRDGSASGNGKGDGAANGKPCAGCVGKADNKNPPGQYENGDDHNAGYECDRNQGIGQTNPAHTGCQEPQSTTPPCVPTAADPCAPPCVPTDTDPCAPPCVPTDTDPCAPPCVPTDTDPCAPRCVPTDEDPCEPPVVCPPVPEPCAPTASPSVGGVKFEKPTPSISPSVKGVKIVRPRANPPAVAGGRLPTTGANVSVLLLLLSGFGLVALGVSVTVATPARHR